MQSEVIFAAINLFASVQMHSVCVCGPRTPSHTSQLSINTHGTPSASGATESPVVGDATLLSADDIRMEEDASSPPAPTLQPLSTLALSDVCRALHGVGHMVGCCIFSK